MYVRYLVIMGFLAQTTLPIMIMEADQRAVRILEDLNGAPTTDLGAFKYWFVTLVFNVMFILIHLTNFPQYGSSSGPLYSFLIFGVNLPWTLVCMRNFILVPTTRAQRLFCIAYDLLVTKSFIRNHLVLQFLSVQGFLESQYFTLMLLDVINLSANLAHVISVVVKKAESLLLVLYLYVGKKKHYKNTEVLYVIGGRLNSLVRALGASLGTSPRPWSTRASA